MKQIQKEQEEKIYRETFIKIKAEAEARKEFGLTDTANDIVETNPKGNGGKSNPTNPGVDNNAQNK